MKVQLRDDYQVPAVEAARQALLERLRQCVSYNASTGLLTWLVSRGKAKAGDVVSTKDPRGYIVIGIDGQRLYAHRVAHALASGSWPLGVIDHINGQKDDNRWSNLRDVPVKLNAQNRHVASRRKRDNLPLGVRKFGSSFRSAISINGSTKHLGTFKTPQEASDAYLSAKRSTHEGNTL